MEKMQKTGDIQQGNNSIVLNVFKKSTQIDVYLLADFKEEKKKKEKVLLDS